METFELTDYIREHPYEISSAILNGTYKGWFCLEMVEGQF